jgi:hypothetical protein
MKKIISSLLFILALTACRQINIIATPTATFLPTAILTTMPPSTPTLTAIPTSELAPYYGPPQPAKIIINNKIYDSEIGTTMWITEVKPDGSVVGEIGDAFAIITPKEPIVTVSNPSLVLKLPVQINPTELWYGIFAVTEDEINLQNPKEGVYRWHPNYEQQPSLPLLAEQELTFSLDPGTYVLEVHASWGGIPPHVELEADYGFLIEVQE